MSPDIQINEPEQQLDGWYDNEAAYLDAFAAMIKADQALRLSAARLIDQEILEHQAEFISEIPTKVIEHLTQVCLSLEWLAETLLNECRDELKFKRDRALNELNENSLPKC